VRYDDSFALLSRAFSQLKIVEFENARQQQHFVIYRHTLAVIFMRVILYRIALCVWCVLVFCC